jgi:hypothetical protein
MKLVIEVNGYIPRSPNAGARKHWGRKMEERLFWEGCIAREIVIGRHEVWHTDNKPKVSYEIQKPGAVRLRDEDNLAASVKHCQDALVNLGLIKDDDPEHIKWGGVTESNGHKAYKTIITIEYT